MKTVLIKPSASLVSIDVTEDTQYVFTTDASCNVEIILNFTKSGVTAELLGIYSLSNASVNLTVTAWHKVPHTSCNIKIKDVLYDGGKSSFIGKIVIDKQAQQTSSFLHDEVLVIGNKVVNVSKPILEIDADDVKASHGATTGRISKDQLYYLMSRGISEQEAETIIAQGFLESLVSSILDDKIRQEVRKIWH